MDKTERKECERKGNLKCYRFIIGDSVLRRAKVKYDKSIVAVPDWITNKKKEWEVKTYMTIVIDFK